MHKCLRLLLLLAITPLVASKPTCRSLTLSVCASADVLQLPTGLNISTLTPQQFSNVADLPSKAITGTYSIAARFCEPEKKVRSRKNTLQVLVHGVTYTKDYWSGLGPPGNEPFGTRYSWIDYASKQGYPTLAFDRLCNGDSSRPNGLTFCQVPFQAEVLKDIIQKAQSGAIGGRKFNKVIPVAHSEGSIIAEYLMQKQPTLATTYVLTGLTNRLLIGGAGSFAAGEFVPAAIGRPDAFGNILDPSYVVATSERGAEGFFYAGDYDPAVAAYDFQNRGTITIGEFGSAALGQLPALGYTGNVLVLNGQRDQIFCAVLPTDPLVGFRGNCGSGSTSFTSKTKVLFPAAKFTAAQVSSQGHDCNLHRNAQQDFKIGHDYLAGLGFWEVAEVAGIAISKSFQSVCSFLIYRTRSTRDCV